MADNAIEYAKNTFREAYHEYGEVRCRACEDTISFDGDDSLEAAKETWNAHVREVHGDE